MTVYSFKHAVEWRGDLDKVKVIVNIRLEQTELVIKSEYFLDYCIVLALIVAEICHDVTRCFTMRISLPGEQLLH